MILFLSMYPKNVTLNCYRFLGKDIITIREAAWLTDNTYKYEDVVRMMGEIIATLRGNIRVGISCCTLNS